MELTIAQLIDAWGRRATLLHTVPVMIIALILSSVFFHSTFPLRSDYSER